MPASTCASSMPSSARLKKPLLPLDRVIDTLAMARRRHPGARVSLDELCQRYGIDNSKRVKHGALLDAEILAEVYIELTGGRQTHARPRRRRSRSPLVAEPRAAAPAPACRLRSRLTAEERGAHAAFVAGLGEAAICGMRYLALMSGSQAWPAGCGLQRRPGGCDRARRNRSGRASAAGSRHCASRRR